MGDPGMEGPGMEDPGMEGAGVEDPEMEGSGMEMVRPWIQTPGAGSMWFRRPRICESLFSLEGRIPCTRAGVSSRTSLT